MTVTGAHVRSRTGTQEWSRKWSKVWAGSAAGRKRHLAADAPMYVGTLGPNYESPPDLRSFASLREAVKALERKTVERAVADRARTDEPTRTENYARTFAPFEREQAQ